MFCAYHSIECVCFNKHARYYCRQSFRQLTPSDDAILFAMFLDVCRGVFASYMEMDTKETIMDLGVDLFSCLAYSMVDVVNGLCLGLNIIFSWIASILYFPLGYVWAS